jgi:hypothetical protein
MVVRAAPELGLISKKTVEGVEPLTGSLKVSQGWLLVSAHVQPGVLGAGVTVTKPDPPTARKSANDTESAKAHEG